MTMTAAHRRATAVLRGEDLPVVEMECDEDGLAHRALTAALNDPDDDVIARTLDEHRASPATSPYCRCGWRPGMSLNDTEADRRQHRAHQADAVRAAILGPSRG